MRRLELAALWRFRPRVLTLVVFFTIAALLVLANISPEHMVNFGLAKFLHTSYGWPLTFHRYVFLQTQMLNISTVGHYCSEFRLAANLAIWLALLAAPTALCEWRLRRQRPRIRWSLRTLLAAVGFSAVLCGWFVKAREQANAEDALIAEIHCKKGKIFVERFGPRWLAPFGVDRFRRRIVAASLGSSSGFGSRLSAGNPENQEMVQRLARLPGLTHLFLELDQVSPQVGDALGTMRRLRMMRLSCWDSTTREEGAPIISLAPIGKLAQLEHLQVDGIGSLRGAHLCLDGLTKLKSLDLHSDGNDDPRVSRECLAAIGEMTRLEKLFLQQMAIDSQDLGHLKKLLHLKNLSLRGFTLAFGSEPGLLRCLPALERLQTLELRDAEVSDDDLRQISALPRLTSLCLANTHVTAEGLSELAASDSLKELEIDIELATPAGLEALNSLKHLKTLYFNRLESVDANSLIVTSRSPEGELDSEICDLEAIRHAMPGVFVEDSEHYSIVTPGSTYDIRALIGFGDDSLPDSPGAWLPSNIPLWITATPLAKNDVWARFDGAGMTDDNGREIVESF